MCITIPQVRKLWYMQCHPFRMRGQLVFQESTERLAAPGLERKRSQIPRCAQRAPWFTHKMQPGFSEVQRYANRARDPCLLHVGM